MTITTATISPAYTSEDMDRPASDWCDYCGGYWAAADHCACGRHIGQGHAWYCPEYEAPPARPPFGRPAAAVHCFRHALSGSCCPDHCGESFLVWRGVSCS